jgi:hypothetical protein
MAQKKIPKEIYNFLSNAEYHLASALALDEKSHIADRIYLLLIALENAFLADEIHHHWVHEKKIPEEYFKKHGLKLDGVRHPVIRVQFDKSKKKAKQILYLSANQLEKLLNVCRYGPGRGAQSIQDYFGDSRWFDDEFVKEVKNRLDWAKLGVELSEKFLKGEL